MIPKTIVEKGKMFLVTKTKDGVLLRQLHLSKTFENHEEYELHDKEIIILKGDYPIVGRLKNEKTNERRKYEFF